MRLVLTMLTLLLLVSAPGCSGGGAEADPWAAGGSSPKTAPKTEGFGEEDFEGPQRAASHDRSGADGGGPRSGPDSRGPEDCSDGIDNDANGTKDCEDPSCANDPICLGDPSKTHSPEPELGFEDCTNKLDDDRDGKVDCEDSDCADDPVCDGENCSDKVDDDGDGKVDCEDSDCADDPVCVESCDNKIDDDGDGKVDCEDRDCREDLICIEDPSKDESMVLVDPAKLAEVAKLPEGGQVGMRAPDFELPLIGRRGKQRLSDLDGYTVILNFWASWCSPCRQEVPALELTWQLYRDKHVIVIGVSIDDKKSDAEDFLGTFPVSYPMLHDPGGENVAKKWKVNSVPTLILIDSAGRVRERHQGYHPKLLRKTITTIDELLEE